MKKITIRYTHIFVAFVLLIIGAMFFIITNNSTVQALSIGEMTIEKRLQNAEKQLNQIAKNPNKQNTALVSFNDFERKEFVADFVAKNSGIKVRHIFHAHIGPYMTSVGGIFVGEEEIPTKEYLLEFEQQLINDAQKFGVDTLRDILVQKIKQLENFPYIGVIKPLEKLSKEKGNMKIGDKFDVKVTYIENTEGQKMIKATKNSLVNAEHRLATLKKNGVQYTGFEITASNKKLVEISKYPGVRAVEIIDARGTRTVPPILPTK